MSLGLLEGTLGVASLSLLEGTQGQGGVRGSRDRAGRGRMDRVG